MCSRDLSTGHGFFYSVLGMLGFIPMIYGIDPMMPLLGVDLVHSAAQLLAGLVLLFFGMGMRVGIEPMNRAMAAFFGMMVGYTVISALVTGQPVSIVLAALYTVSAVITAYCGFGMAAERTA